MRVQIWLAESLNWISTALQNRVDIEEVLGGCSNPSREIVKILEDNLKTEYENQFGKLPESNPSLSLSSRKSFYSSRKRTITLQVPNKYIDVIEYLEKQVSIKRELGVNITLSEELLDLLDQSLFTEKRKLWLQNAEALGYKTGVKE